MTVRAITAGELVKFRGGGQYAEVFAIPRVPNVIYTARLASLPASTDMVASISVTGGSGTAASILPDMKILVGTTAGGDDLGFCRVRATPTLPGGVGTVKIGELSHIDWQGSCYLTIVDDYDIFPRHLKIISGVPYIDYETAYSDQHENFDPIVNMGGHRLLLLEGASVAHIRSATTSEVFDGTIASYLHEAPDAASVTNETTANATITYDAEGHFCEYLTITTNDGKTWRGVRYAFVIDPANLVSNISRLRITENANGVSADFEMVQDAKLTDFRHRAFVIIFARDYFNGVQESIGYNTYEENILASGRISDERMNFNDETGATRFTIQNWKYWMTKLPGFPFGIERIMATPDAWTNMATVTVDRAIWALLHEYSTVTRICDFHPSGDTRYAAELAAASSNLEAQVEDLATTSILADLVFDRFGSAWLRVEPQLVPEADRSGWAIVQEITTSDYQNELDVELNTYEETAQVNLSGVSVPQYGSSSPHFSLSYGRIPAPFGDLGMESTLLLESQAQANTLSGLFMGWDNRKFDGLSFEFIGTNRMFSIAEYCRAYIEILAADNPRGIAYTGYLVPRNIIYDYDESSGFFTSVVEFQDESQEKIAVTGDFPADTGIDNDFSFDPPPGIKIPPITPLPAFLPPTQTGYIPKTVAMFSDLGVYYTKTFDAVAFAEWLAMNNGIDTGHFDYITKMVKTPSEAIYILVRDVPSEGDFIYRAGGVGGTFSLIATGASLGGNKILGLGVNPESSDQICAFSTDISSNGKLYIGNTTLSAGASAIAASGFEAEVVYLENSWYLFFSLANIFNTPYAAKFTISGSIVSSADITTALGQDASAKYAVALPSKFIQWDSSGAGGHNSILKTLVPTLSTVIKFCANHQGVAFSPDGTVAMGAKNDFAPYLSTDEGATWSNVGGVLSTGFDIWENARNNYGFIFGGGPNIRFTPDRGASYTNHFGNLQTIAPLIDVRGLRFIN